MKNVIIFTNDQGGVSVCIPTGEISIGEVKNKDCPVDSYIIPESVLPLADKDFFDAWEQKSGVVFVNIQKAKEITKKRLRSERQHLLELQDIEFQRAIESGSSTQSIIAEKQRLRDITNLVDQAKTLDDLRSITVIGV